MIISYSKGTGKNCFWAFVQSKNVVLYYYFCEITKQFLVAKTVIFILVTLTNRNQIIQISCDKHVSDQRCI